MAKATIDPAQPLYSQMTATYLVSLLELLECDYTRNITIRFVCGVRKRLNSPEHEPTNTTLSISSRIERYYHAIGAEDRNKAFTEGSNTTVPYQTCFTWSDFTELLSEFIEEDERATFTFSEFCDFVEDSWLEGGKFQWAPDDIDCGNSKMPRWRNNAQAILQQSDAVVYSRKRSSWVVL